MDKPCECGGDYCLTEQREVGEEEAVHIAHKKKLCTRFDRVMRKARDKKQAYRYFIQSLDEDDLFIIQNYEDELEEDDY